MQQIINFIIRFQAGLFFWLMFGVAILLTIQANTYHKAKLISSSNYISGWLFDTSSAVSAYFQLGEENKKLAQENAALRESLHRISSTVSSTFADSTYKKEYDVVPARIIANSYRKPSNYLLLNKGIKDSVFEDMAIISSLGIVGIVEESNQHYARVISLLNNNISINAALQKSAHFGSLRWDVSSPYFAQLIDVPRSAKIAVGDTVVTGGNSLIFPKGIPIGSVNSFYLNENIGYYEIEVALFNDMTSLDNVYALKLKTKDEAIQILNNTDE